RSDRKVCVHSLDFAETAEFELDALEKRDAGWVEYLKGVAWALQEAGYALRGWEGMLSGDVPSGAGLSSSAALELATARAFASVSALPWDPVEMARLAQRAENEWVGVNCGIMDQLISAAGQAGHALLIDCRSLALTPVPLPPETVVVVLDTATRRGLVASAYNERRSQCEQAAEFCGVPALRDLSLAEFETRAGTLDALTRRRARHVITENARTVRAAEALRQGDAGELGRLMNASHGSLREDFEVSSDALNAMVVAAQAEPGCYGARMTGAGFGGCAVALVAAAQAQIFTVNVADAYQAATGIEPRVYLCRPVAGAQMVLTTLGG
ncbi:MAG: galactokinase, partial [Anaerolineae bacterium]|nr:galactokinase [Anaerolineae bacterium]